MNQLSQKTGSPLGVWVFPPKRANLSRTTGYQEYLYEILKQAGIWYEKLNGEDFPSALEHIRILVTAGDEEIPDKVASSLRAWVNNGGCWISIGGVCGQHDLFGVKADPPSWKGWGSGIGNLGEGYLTVEDKDHPAVAGLKRPLHYFNGVPVLPDGCRVVAKSLDVHQQPTDRALITEHTTGTGRAVLIAPDLTGTIVRIQQGTAITRDGIPAPDGSAALSDGALKSDDGIVLDWIFDRQPVPGAPGLQGFLDPAADQWREILLRTIFDAGVKTRTPLMLLWYWPRNLPAVGHISHDTDSNEREKALRLLEVLAEAKIHSTWMHIAPGYTPDIMQCIEQAGHESGFHYDAMTEGTRFCEEEFLEQLQQIEKALGGRRPRSNKNHYLRWEGDTEFYQWCSRHGITLDQSKGSSKTGEIGYQFGTCHPYYPVGPDGYLFNVLEMITPTQDLEVFAPKAIMEPILQVVTRHYGVAHFLFHPSHILTEGVDQALLEAVNRGRQLGLEWWTAEQISRWQYSRRKITWTSRDDNEVNISCPEKMQDASLLFLLPENSKVSVDEKDPARETIKRWGFTFQTTVLQLEPERSHRIKVD
jgi:hypothetical protein